MPSNLNLLRLALRGRCPRCGKGKLYCGLLTVRDSCQVCGLDLRDVDVGDGFVVPIILVLGTIVVAAAFWVEFTFSPPLWVHMVLWPIVTTPLAILMTRFLKAGLIAQQFRTRADEMGL